MQGFEIDHKAFRAQNLGRQPQHLIREAIQNAFDEKPDHVRVTIEAVKGRGLKLVVADDGPGFADPSEIWTLFASGKRDDPTQRGRLGRGLKELLSVCSEGEVATRSGRVYFDWNGRTLLRRHGRLAGNGTTISVTVPSWKKTELSQIVDYLRLFVPPEGTALIVNGVVNDRPVPEYAVDANVKTVVYTVDGIPEERFRRTTLHLLKPGTQGRWIYEMGIPVEKIPEEDGFEWSINVGQRVPLRPERDMLPRTYIHSLYAAVANALMDKLPIAEMTDLWMEEAVGHWDFDKEKQGKVYVERRFGQHAARAIVNDAHDRNVHAANDGVNVVRTEHLSASVRDLVRDKLPSTADLYPVACAEARYIPQAEWTDGEHKFVAFAKWLAVQINVPIPEFIILDAPGASCQADSAGSGTRIRVNRAGVGNSFFEHPRIANWLPLIVHEIAHRTGNGHDAVFWQEVERIMGDAAQAIRDDKSGGQLDKFGI